MAFACHFEFEAKEKSEDRKFEFSTTEGSNWIIDELWRTNKNSKRREPSRHCKYGVKEGCFQVLNFYVTSNNDVPAQESYYVELRIFNPMEPFLGFIYSGKEMYIFTVFKFTLEEYIERFYLDNEHRTLFRCSMNFYPLSYSHFIRSVPLLSDGVNTIISVKEEQMRTALEFLSEKTPNLESEYFSDINIHCGPKTFRISRNLLTKRSVVFSNKLKKLANTGSFTVTDVTHRTLHEMLHFIHTGHFAKGGFIDIKNLFKAANLYKVNDLKDICANYLDNIDCPVSDDQDSEVDIELKDSLKEVNCDNLEKLESVDYNSSTDNSKIERQEELADDINRAILKMLSKEKLTDNDAPDAQNRFLKQKKQAENSMPCQIISNHRDRKNSDAIALTVEHEFWKLEKLIENETTSTHDRNSKREAVAESAKANEHNRCLKKVTFSTSTGAGHSRTSEEVFRGSPPTPGKKRYLKQV